MNCYSYKNLIKKPARTTETTNTLLDLIFVTDYSKVRDADVWDFVIADHKFIYAVYNLTSKKENPLLALKIQTWINLIIYNDFLCIYNWKKKIYTAGAALVNTVSSIPDIYKALYRFTVIKLRLKTQYWPLGIARVFLFWFSRGN